MGEFFVSDENIAILKFNKNLLIRDKDYSWSTLNEVRTRINEKAIYLRFKTCFGEDLTVLPSHPLTTVRGALNFITEASSDKFCVQHKDGGKLQFDGKKKVISKGKNVKLDFTMGRLIGAIVAKGSFMKNIDGIIFEEETDDLKELLDSLDIQERKKNNLGLIIKDKWLLHLVFNKFKIEKRTNERCLPLPMLEYNEDFILGMLRGVVDNKGNLNKSQLMIRVSSRSLALQLAALFRHFGYSVGNTYDKRKPPRADADRSYDIWGVYVSKSKNSTHIEGCFKISSLIQNNGTPRYKPYGSTMIKNVMTVGFDNPMSFGLETESKTYVVNNLITHDNSEII